MNPQQSTQSSNQTSQTNQPQPGLQFNGPLNAMQQGERVIFDIKRHPIGMLFVYLGFGLLLLIVGVMAAVAPSVLTEFDKTIVGKIGLSVFLITAVFSLIFVFIARTVYYGNRWILTSDSLTQVQQNSLFSKQNSQMGLDNLEDVTVEQHGIFTHVFSYGVLRAQTAGEHGKFQFIYCRNPNEYAQLMLRAREDFEHGNMYNQPESHQNN